MIYLYFYTGEVNKNNEHDVSYGLLFSKLEEIYGKTFSFDDVKRGKYGKPYFENHDINFNISHTKGAVLVAFCDKEYSEIGADTEKVRKYHINKFLSETENKFCENNDVLYTKTLSLKESYGKYTGKGLTDFKNVCFDENFVSDKNRLDFYSIEKDKYVISLCYDKNKKFRLTFIG